MIGPKVVVSSAGIGYAYQVALASQKAGILRWFVTGALSNYTSAELDPRRVKRLWVPGVMNRAFTYIPRAKLQPWTYWVTDNIFDLLAYQYAREADIFHFFNHSGLYSLNKMLANGIVSIVQRDSAHPVVQHNLMHEEYENFGIRRPIGNQAVLDKSVSEIDAADYVLVPSDYVGRTMSEQGVPDSKILKIPLGFHPSRFLPGQKRDTTFRVVYAGALSLQKGIPYLLEAFTRLNIPDSELLLVGNPTPDVVAVLSRYSDKFRHLPFVRQGNLASIFQQASVFVIASIQDGCPAVVHEAAACGLPVIVSENVGTTIRDGLDGFIVPVRSAEAITEKLLYLYQHPEICRAMGAAARCHVQQFTWDSYHSELAGHYDAIWDRYRSTTIHSEH